MGIFYRWKYQAAAVAAVAAAAAAAATTTETFAAMVRHRTGSRMASVARPLPLRGGVETLAFPYQQRGVPAVGHFHSLPSLQCRLHPAAADRPSPDSTAVAGPMGRGSTGWMLRTNASAAATFIPYAAGTCASPLEGVRGSPFCDTSTGRQNGAVVPNVSFSSPESTDGDGPAEFAWSGAAFHAKATRWAIAKGPVGAAAKSLWYHPQPCADYPRQRGLVCEEEITRLLTLQRNHWFGEVRRQHGIFDIVAVSRASFGVALDVKATVVGAVDTVSAAAGPRDGDRIAVVTYKTRDGHTRPVLVGEAALLSLGRGLLADPSWLGPHFPGGLTSLVSFSQAPRRVLTTWSLADTDIPATNSSLWIQGVASTLCWPPAASFVMNGSLCDGVDDAQPSGQDQSRPGWLYKANYGDGSRGHFVGGAEVGARWIVEPPRRPLMARGCPPEFDNLDDRMVPLQPIWLFGRGSRELHTTMPGGEADLSLASRLSSCTYNRTRPELLSRTPVTGILSESVSELSQRYNQDFFGKDPPADPVSELELTLAVFVVMPELAAVLLLLLQLRSSPTRPRGINLRQGLSCALVVLAGAAALVGVSHLDRVEHAGHAWRAASVRLETRLPINRTEEEHMDRDTFGYRGRILTYTETLFLVARTGYRPTQTRWMLVGSTAAYAALTVAVLVRAVVEVFSLPAPFKCTEDHGHQVEGKIASARQWCFSVCIAPLAPLRTGAALSN